MKTNNKSITTISKTIITLALLVFIVGVFSGCGSSNTFSKYVVCDRTGLHVGDSLPEIYLDGYEGSVEWEDETQLIVAGNYDYNYIYTDTHGEKAIGVITINATDHVSDGNPIIYKEATCTEDGLMGLVCSICGEEYEAVSIPALGHDYSIPNVDPGDCQHLSSVYYTCSRCGAVETDSDGNPVIVYGDYGDCVWATDEDGNYIILEEDIVVAPTCDSVGSGYVRCIYYDICGSTMLVDIEKSSCVYDVEVHTDGDCCNYGYTEYCCAFCGSYMMDPDDPTQTYKVYDDYYGDHQFEYGICKICGCVDEEGFDRQYLIGKEDSSAIKANLYLYETIDGVPYYNMVVYGEGEMIEYDPSSSLVSGSGYDSPWELDTIKIGTKVLSYAQLIRNVTIFDGATTLMDGMFANCTGLQTVVLPSDTQRITEKMFYKCSQLTEINIPDTVVAVDDYAFYGCKILDIELTDLPKELTYIGEQAFYSCWGMDEPLDFRYFAGNSYGDILIESKAFYDVDSSYAIINDYTNLGALDIFNEGLRVYAEFASGDSDYGTYLSNYDITYLGDKTFEEVYYIDDDNSVSAYGVAWRKEEEFYYIDSDGVVLYQEGQSIITYSYYISTQLA